MGRHLRPMRQLSWIESNSVSPGNPAVAAGVPAANLAQHGFKAKWRSTEAGSGASGRYPAWNFQAREAGDFAQSLLYMGGHARYENLTPRRLRCAPDGLRRAAACRAVRDLECQIRHDVRLARQIRHGQSDGDRFQGH